MDPTLYGMRYEACGRINSYNEERLQGKKCAQEPGRGVLESQGKDLGRQGFGFDTKMYGTIWKLNFNKQIVEIRF